MHSLCLYLCLCAFLFSFIHSTLTCGWSVSFAFLRSLIPSPSPVSQVFFAFIRIQTICSSNPSENLHMQIQSYVHLYEAQRFHSPRHRASGGDCDRVRRTKRSRNEQTQKMHAQAHDNNANLLFSVAVPRILSWLWKVHSNKRMENRFVFAFAASKMVLQIRVCIANRFNCVCRGQRQNVVQRKLNGTEAFYWACNMWEWVWASLDHLKNACVRMKCGIILFFFLSKSAGTFVWKNLFSDLLVVDG